MTAMKIENSISHSHNVFRVPSKLRTGSELAALNHQHLNDLQALTAEI